PADVRVAPRLAVQAGVLLEVGHLLARRQGRVAPAPDERGGLGRDLVGIDLVAQQQQAVGPQLAAGLEPARECPQRVDAQALGVVERRQRVGRTLRRAHPAGAEDEAQPALALAGADQARWAAVRRRPDRLAVEGDRVLV